MPLASLKYLSELTGLVLHLRPEELTGVNGSNVTQWDDVSGTNSHAQQNTTGLIPTIKTNAINGYSAVYFDGSKVLKCLNPSNFDFSNNFSVFGVIKRIETSTASVWIAKGNDVYSTYGWYADRQLLVATQPVISILAPNFKDNMWNALNFIIDAGVATAYNSQLKSVSKSNFVASSNAQALILGAYNDGAPTAYNNGFVGEMSEIIIYNRPLVDRERCNVVNYLRFKYNL